MLVLLPPSEGKTSPRRGRPLDLSALSFPDLQPHRAEVLEALVTLCTTQEATVAATALGLGSTLTGEVRAGALLRQAPTARADRVYSGVLYEALDLASLDEAARRRATSWLSVTSGLFGLLRLSDRVPAYRLSGAVSLPGIGTVSTYWGRRLDASVREAAGSGLVVDLRSSTYGPFWRPGPDLAPRTVAVRVLQDRDGRRSVVSHLNKATKGRLVRALLSDPPPRGGSGRRGGSHSPARFADHLRSLGWKAEEGPAGRHGTTVDVVVSEL